jgi:hypothetical protein
MLDEGDQLELPAALQGELHRLYAPRTVIPAGLEQSILAGARARLAQRRKARMRMRIIAAVSAAAAAIVAGFHFYPEKAPPPPPVAINIPDFNADGRIDMLDAYFLARRVRVGEGLKAEWDLNRDGKVDSADVDGLARQSVSLAGGTVR